ncbi:SPARC [Antennarius striatus]|uniref:SPARC n=1 Tax=Antennarius striatus TaxID=241820 RepID=UPI0035B29639
MKPSVTLVLFLFLSLHTCASMGGRGQHKQSQAELRLRPYIGRVAPERLCELLKCRVPVGSWCQVVQENGVLVPKCVCPQSCPRQRAPVCSVVGRTYGSECLLHKEACRKRRHISLAHTGLCLVPKGKCTQGELSQFPYRLLDWFLLLSRMGVFLASPAPSQICLSYDQRARIAQQRFTMLDRNKDGKLSRRDLKKLRYKTMPLEHCATPFFLSCDRNRNSKVTLEEWITCLVDGPEAWFYQLTSMRMGSRKLCPSLAANYF